MLLNTSRQSIQWTLDRHVHSPSPSQPKEKIPRFPTRGKPLVFLVPVTNAGTCYSPRPAVTKRLADQSRTSDLPSDTPAGSRGLPLLAHTITHSCRSYSHCCAQPLWLRALVGEAQELLQYLGFLTERPRS